MELMFYQNVLKFWPIIEFFIFIKIKNLKFFKKKPTFYQIHLQILLIYRIKKSSNMVAFKWTICLLIARVNHLIIDLNKEEFSNG